MASRGNPKNVTLGPGYLYLAPLGSTEPSDLSTEWDTAWRPLGYTDQGSTQSYAPSYENVEVAEEVDPIDSVPTGREITVSFASAETTAKNYKSAMNGGTITLDTGGEFVTYEPPALGDETNTMLGWESEDHLERWVWRNAKQTGTVETQRQKGANKATIPMEFTCFKPSDGSSPFVRLSNRDGEVEAAGGTTG